MEDFVNVSNNDFSQMKIMLRNEMCSNADSLFIEQGIKNGIPYIVCGGVVAVDINATNGEHSVLLFDCIGSQSCTYSDGRIGNYGIYIKKYLNMDIDYSEQYNYDVLSECLFYNGVSSENIIAILSDIMGGIDKSNNDDFFLYNVYAVNKNDESLQNDISNYPYVICDDTFYQNNHYSSYHICIKDIKKYGDKYDDMLDFLHKNW